MEARPRGHCQCSQQCGRRISSSCHWSVQESCCLPIVIGLCCAEEASEQPADDWAGVWALALEEEAACCNEEACEQPTALEEACEQPTASGSNEDASQMLYAACLHGQASKVSYSCLLVTELGLGDASIGKGR